MGAENINYGNGFLVSKKWKESVHRYWKISERISVLQMKTSKSQEKQVTNKMAKNCVFFNLPNASLDFYEIRPKVAS